MTHGVGESEIPGEGTPAETRSRDPRGILPEGASGNLLEGGLGKPSTGKVPTRPLPGDPGGRGAGA